MVGRSDFFRYISMYVDSMVMTLRGVVECFITVWALVGLLSGTVDRIGKKNHVQRAIMCQEPDETVRTEVFRASLAFPYLRNPSCRICICCFWEMGKVRVSTNNKSLWDEMVGLT